MANAEINDLSNKVTPLSTDEVEIQATAGGASAKATLANVSKAISIPASQVTDFDTEVANNSAVTANTAKTGVTTQISNVVEDTTPQLGGDLDAQSNDITSVGNLSSSTAQFGGAASLRSFNVQGSGLNGRLSIQGAADGDNPGVELTTDDNASRVLMRLNRIGTDGTELAIYTEPDGGSITENLTIESDGTLNLNSNPITGLTTINTKSLPSGDLVGTSDTQTLANKTLTSPSITTPTGIVKADVGLGNVDNTSDATKNSAVATLTNKTIGGSQLVNNSVPTAKLDYTNGIIVNSIAGAQTTSGSTELALATITVPAQTTACYVDISAYFSAYNNTSADHFKMRIREGSGTGGAELGVSGNRHTGSINFRLIYCINNIHDDASSTSPYLLPASTAQTFTVTVARLSGSGTLTTEDDGSVRAVVYPHA